jgi:hypothetical protein
MSKQAVTTALALSIFFWSSAGRAADSDMLVLESNTLTIQIGSHVTEAQMAALPAGARVKVLLPSRQTKVFEGPSIPRGRPWGGTRRPTNE